ncbi:MAG TPA: helix-hairpin-helix domain-containing protein [Schlesneria sp.]|jgi:competence protein ComEA
MSDLSGTSTESVGRIVAPIDPSEIPLAQESLRSVSVPITQAWLDESTSVATSESKTVLWVRRSDQIVVWLLSVVLLMLLGIHWVRLSRWGISPVELSSQKPREYYYSLDINKASWVEWAQLDGIGEVMGRRIVANREEHGLFRNPDDVSRVKGIGPRSMQKIRPFLRGGTESESDQPMPKVVE